MVLYLTLLIRFALIEIAENYVCDLNRSFRARDGSQSTARTI